MENGVNEIIGKEGPSTTSTGRPTRSNGPPKATTTISTIAIKAGDRTRLTLAVLKSTDWVFLRVDEMQPSMLDVGNNLEEALSLQDQHSELMQKLQAKQSNIEELLSKADQMVSEQPEPEAAVYEAMADSLGSAWKELSRQLQQRAILLEQAVKFFMSVNKHKEQMDQIEQYLLNLPKADSMETVKQIGQRHDQMRLDMLDVAVEVMTYGQLTIEKLREIGAFVDNEQRPRQTLDACARIEDVMLRINDRRKRVELTWDDRKSQLDLSQQACQLMAELQQIEDWINKHSDQLQHQTDLGDSETSAEYLLREHEQFFNDAKRMHDKANRLYPVAEQLISMGYDDGGQLVQRCGILRRRFDELLHQAELRRQFLLAAVAFFKAAQTAILHLDELESEIRSLSLTRHSETMARRHADLASRVQETAQPALAQGRSLLQRVSSGEPGAQGVARKLTELERRVAALDDLCTAHKAEALARSQKYQEFLQQYTTLHTWLVNVGEAFLYSHRDMGTTLPTVNEFIDRHRQIAADIAHKENDILRFLQWAREMQGEPGDPDYEDMKRKADDIRTRWDRLKKAIDTRVELANYYHQFHRQALQHAADMDTFEAMARTYREISDQSSQRQLDEMWSSLGRSYDQLKAQGEKFLVQSRLVNNDPGLDIRTAQLCVETLLEHFANRQRASHEVWSDWQKKLVKDKEFQETWNNFIKECRRYIHYISELKSDASLAFTHFEHPPAIVAERQERALADFVPKAKQAQREMEHLLRTAETLAVQGDTRGEKEKIVEELLQTHQQFQQTVTQFEVLTSMTITFFKNLQQVDEWIERVQEKFQPDRLPRHDTTRMEQFVQEHQAATQTVEQLLRFARTEGQQIVHRARQPDVAPEIRKECEKIPPLVEERSTKWERVWTEQQQQLEQHSHVAKFEREIVEIFETISTLRRQVQDLKSKLGESAQAAQTAAREFREVERNVNQTDIRVRSVVSTAETLLAGPYRGNQTLRQRTDELKERWSEFRRDLDDLTQKLHAATNYWTLVEQSEEWVRETTEYIVDVGRKVTEAKTSEDASRLMGQLERYIKPKQTEQEARLKDMEKHARILYGEEAEHKLQRHKKKYKEIVDSFILVGDQLSSLSETYRTEEYRQREIREQLAQRPPPVPPRFVQTLKETEVIEGSKVEFTCQVTGYPTPEVKWYKDGVPIEDNPDYETTTTTQGTCILKIEETFTEDSAVYSCRATNDAGTTETSARLTVKEAPHVRMEPPVFTKKLESTTVEETSSHTFECHVTGEPTPVVSWYKNEQCIDYSPDHRTSFINGVCQMRIEETMIEDEARYTCRATNAAGEAATSAKLTVTPKGGFEAPIFISPLQNITVQQGEKIVLECFVRGFPRPEIEWRQNNIVLRDSRDVRTTFDGSRATLTISEAYPIHAGSYMVIARNRVGETSSTGFVTVRTRPAFPEGADTFGMEAPRISPPLQSQTLVENTGLTFETRITGQPAPEVVWYKDDAPIYPGPDVQIFKDSYGYHRLVIERVTRHDSGVYLVRATNAAGEAKSLATLQVNSPATPITKTTKRITEEFYESQSGAYSPGTTAPSFARPLQDIRVPLGTRARIDAVITGTPKPKVTWYFNGQPITQSTSTRQIIEIGDTYSILIPQVGPEHLGTYTLVAENERGTAQSTGTLITESGPPSRASPYGVSPVPARPKPYVEPPHFGKTLVSVVASEGEEARFEGYVTGLPTPEITWYKDGKELRDPNIRTSYDNGKVTLIIPRVAADHTGKYTCSAKNDGGLATSSAQLLVTVSKEAPDFIQRLISKEVLEGTALRWEVKVSGDPMPQVVWLKSGVQIRPSEKIQIFEQGNGVHVLYIPNLQLSDTGQFTCKAENEAGEARSTADLIVRGKDQPPRVYYHVTRVSQRNQELGMEANRFHSGPLSDDDTAYSADTRGTMGILL